MLKKTLWNTALLLLASGAVATAGAEPTRNTTDRDAVRDIESDVLVEPRADDVSAAPVDLQTDLMDPFEATDDRGSARGTPERGPLTGPDPGLEEVDRVSGRADPVEGELPAAPIGGTTGTGTGMVPGASPTTGAGGATGATIGTEAGDDLLERDADRIETEPRALGEGGAPAGQHSTFGRQALEREGLPSDTMRPEPTAGQLGRATFPIEQVNRAIVDGDFALANQLAQQGLISHPSHAELLYLRGVALVRLGELDQGLYHLRLAELSATDPHFKSLAIYRQGIGLTNAGQCELAELAFTRYADLVRPTNPDDALLALGMPDRCVIMPEGPTQGEIVLDDTADDAAPDRVNVSGREDEGTIETDREDVRGEDRDLDREDVGGADHDLGVDREDVGGTGDDLEREDVGGSEDEIERDEMRDPGQDLEREDVGGELDVDRAAPTGIGTTPNTLPPASPMRPGTSPGAIGGGAEDQLDETGVPQDDVDTSRDDWDRESLGNEDLPAPDRAE